MLPIAEKNDLDFNYEKYRALLAKGAELSVETPEGTYKYKVIPVK